ncbi:hypothetical protein A1O7_03783 [Cladophialophora yegresii CBS 114405]|uniref:DUF7371 domain-containing protein n=1 Tax=Cladophialophora yegresii CBS 114405 TaxID=1182544 RepID=W9VV53_9EURO|nr:uncharacterized protein A1O7_03783 [Cladophialophora yegresii CBS 114405]EXJ59637.1 hypothetical protein A1O7_03783 [Cladophialophora yegresii CBS 114405]
MWNHVTIYKTVTNVPPTVTILLEDPDVVASSWAAVDTAQVSQEVVEAPVSNKPIGTQTFVDSVRVSGFEATEMSNTPGASVFYMSKSVTSSMEASIVAKVTTVTVSPLQLSTSQHQQDIQVNTTTSTAADSNVHGAFTSPYGGWNGSASAGSSLIGPATANNGSDPIGTGAYPGTLPFMSGTDVQATLTQSQWTSTVTEIATVYATVPVESDYGYNTAAEDHGTVTSDVGDLQKRQTCVWISATIGGQEVGWCNNWAGGSTYTFTSWETTTTPSFIPGIGTMTHSSTSAGTAATGGVTIQTSVPLSSNPPPAPTATSCGEVGPFQIGFDDLIPNTSDDSFLGTPMIQNPYNFLNWGDGWGYVPPPSDPFPPRSGDRLAQWDPTLNNTVLGSPNAGSIPPGSIGAWSRNSKHYWFSADSAYVGCDNGSRNLSEVCDFVATSYRWNNATQSEVVVATQHFHIPPCPDLVNCQLTMIEFNDLFYKMSTLQFYANVQGQLSKFWVDSINMNWYDNSCEAGLARISRQF